ncbi:hypothetical protein JCM10449v2_002724 [Rhodotorula kratochvilovae]
MAQVTNAEAQRIMSHMNKEHSESLGHYLSHFARLPSSLAYANPEITAFTTPSMKIAYGPAGARKEYVHAFDPPMHAGEARKRLEEMHQEAKVKLGISDATIDSIPLSIPALISIFACSALSYYLLTVRPASLSSFLPWQARAFAPLLSLLGYAQTADNAGRAIKAFWVGGLAVAHVAEAYACLPQYFMQYNVKSAAQRWTWRFLTVLGGFPVWQSLRDAGKAEEKKLKSA